MEKIEQKESELEQGLQEETFPEYDGMTREQLEKQLTGMNAMIIKRRKEVEPLLEDIRHFESRVRAIMEQLGKIREKAKEKLEN
jgi:predicted  nucleic acid-binding Zn-ribbon protein